MGMWVILLTMHHQFNKRADVIFMQQ